MPLTIPNHYNQISLLALDPGLNNTGVAHYLIDSYTGEILRLEVFTLASERLVNTTLLDEQIHSERVIKILKLRNTLREYLTIAQPQIVVHEAPFYNPLRPTAYRALVEVITAIQTVVIENNPNTRFEALEPLLVKKAVGFYQLAQKAKGKEAKLLIRQCILAIPCFFHLLGDRLNYLDEHSIDALAVGYAYLKLIKGDLS